MELSVLDLYAGAGGLSLGFSNAGFSLVGAVEIDDWAAWTYSVNLGNHIFRTNVRQFVDEKISDFRGVDIMIGGPPCQGFSISARGRKEDYDSRNDEVFNFLDAVNVVKPHAAIIENVAHFQKFLHPSGKYYSDVVKDRLDDLGYEVRIFTLDSANFGLPQRRVRTIIIASRGQIPDLHQFETHGDSKFTWRTVADAISDLPVVIPRAVEEDAILAYDMPPKNDYQSNLRLGSDAIHNHVPMRHSPRLIERFSQIPVGGNGLTVWDSHAPRRRGGGDGYGVQFDQNHRRMSPNLPAPTITASMYSTCLHPYQNRNITVREAARLQGFPDYFRFFGKRTTLSRKLLEKKGLHGDTKLNQLNQVGNAVPPLLAQVIATAIRESI